MRKKENLPRLFILLFLCYFSLKKAEIYAYLTCGDLLRVKAATERKSYDDQPHPLHLPRMVQAAFGGIDAGGVNAGMAQNVGQSGQIPLQTLECPREQMPQIVRKHLACRYTRRAAEGFHLPPDI